jgi:ribosomal protein S18 acetylase RimI-like enzyme
MNRPPVLKEKIGKTMSAPISYRFDVVPTAQQVIELYNDAGLPRPTHDPKRIKAMFENSDLIITAWDQDKLVGISRTITDWVWCSYLADLVVSPGYKRSGIGKKLVELSREKVGEQSMLLLLSVPTAMDYYPRVGFVKENRAFIIHRTE